MNHALHGPLFTRPEDGKVTILIEGAGSNRHDLTFFWRHRPHWSKKRELFRFHGKPIRAFNEAWNEAVRHASILRQHGLQVYIIRIRPKKVRSSAMFSMKIELDNDCFSASGEIPFIIREVARKIEAGIKSGTITDLSGNSVGTWAFEDEAEEDHFHPKQGEHQ